MMDGSGDTKLADPVALAILTHVETVEAENPGKLISPEAIARAIAERKAKRDAQGRVPPDAWRRYFRAVKDQALHLARRGQITVTRKGKPVAAADLKGLSGVWRLRVRRDGDPALDSVPGVAGGATAHDDPEG